MPTNKTNFILYKIYSENCLLYLGRTKQPLQTRIRGHFFGKPMHRKINIECVTKIEYATFPSEADMNVYEIYYINKLKPPLNRDDKARDFLTLELPEVHFIEYHCHLMDKWREEIQKADAADAEKRKLKAQLELERRAKRKEIFEKQDISLEEKQELWVIWLEQIYEPQRNELL